MKTLFFILAFAGAFVALTVALNLPRERRLRRLAMSRAGGHDFAAVRDSLPEIPDEFVLDIYRAVQNLVPGKNVPLRADDDLWQTLEIDQGSLDDLIEELVGSPDEAAEDSTSSAPIATFADLARAAWRKKQRSTRSSR